MERTSIKRKSRAALKYAEKGWPVFPLHTAIDGKCSCGNPKCNESNNVGKHPRWDQETLPNGFKNATTNVEQVKAWWKRWPDANIGVATGVKSFVVLDVDGPKGKKSLKALEKKYGKLPKTVTSRTGGGGKHFYFITDQEVECSASKIGDKLDIKGGGGYIIMPPSDHKSGRKYKWVKGLDPASVAIADMPDWLLDLANKRENKSSNVKCSAPVPYNQNPNIPEGRRNDTLFRLGCSLWAKGFGYDNLTSKLNEINTAKCRPPLDSKEVDSILKSITKLPSRVQLE